MILKFKICKQTMSKHEKAAKYSVQDYETTKIRGAWKIKVEFENP